MTDEVRITNAETGGEKGQKLDRFDLIPAESLRQIAHHFGVGAKKYADRNWERGYNWDLSYGALQRHLNAWWGGEDIDEETGSSHLAAAGFHVLALLEFERTHRELDTRPTTVARRQSSVISGPGRTWFLPSVTIDAHEVDPSAFRLLAGDLVEPTHSMTIKTDGFFADLFLDDEPPVEDQPPRSVDDIGSGERATVGMILRAVDGVELPVDDIYDEQGDEVELHLARTSHETIVGILNALEDAGLQITKA